MNTKAMPAQTVRVLALGRSQPARTLAADPRARVIAAADELTALGELGSLPASEPREATVVIMPERIARSEGLTGTIESIRTLEPGARFVAVTEGRGRIERVEGIDAWISDKEDADSILALLDPHQQEHIAQAASPAPQPAPPSARPAAPIPSDERAPSPQPPSPAEPPALRLDSPGEATILAALTRGQDIAAPALELIKRRVGAGSLRFVSAEESPTPPRAPVGEHVAAVAANDRPLGWLIGPACAASALDSEASTLSLWMLAQKQVSQLRHEAYTDPLTGAWNRRYFDRFAESLIRDAGASRRPVTILLFDIDDFKHYNDAYGHEAGDDILRETVRLLNSTVRADDRVCRIGGDEFAVIFHEPAGPREAASNHPTSIFQIANRFCRLIRDCRFRHLGDESRGTLTISGGLATYPWDGVTLSDLVRHADHLILESKRQGKNVICYGSCPPPDGARPPGP